jgi:5-methylcytosine-specific restriction endonuclease McrA
MQTGKLKGSRPSDKRPGVSGRTSTEVLVLNTAYEAVGLTSIRRAINLLLKEKAESLINKNREIRGGNLRIPVPSVIRLKYYIKPIFREAYPTKRNIFIRDRFRCQYCGSTKDLTVDHIIPKVRGGKDTWTNLVCACKKCNNQKGNRTPEEAGMRLLSKPRKPSYLELMILSRREIPEEWKGFLYFSF